MSKDHALVERDRPESQCCGAEARIEDEMAPYELIHALLQEVWMLEEMVVETRKEVNFFSDGGKVYDGDDFSSESFSNYYRYFYMPAMDRYIELYGIEAIFLP